MPAQQAVLTAGKTVSFGVRLKFLAKLLNPVPMSEPEGMNHQADFEKMDEGLKALQEMVAKMVQESRATSSAIQQLTQELRSHLPHPGAWCSINGGIGVAHPSPGEYRVPTRFCCVEFRFPKFDGYGLDEWLCKTQQFFEVDETPPDARIRLASIHLEGRAATWHQIFMRGKSYATLGWDEYVGALKIRFGEEAFGPMAELIKLRQDGTVGEYMDRFDALLNKVSMSEEHAVSFFLGGLKEEIQYQVRMLTPRTLLHALQLAKQIEFVSSQKVNEEAQVHPEPAQENDKAESEVLVSGRTTIYHLL